MTGYDLVIIAPLWRRTRNIARMYESAYVATPLARVLFVASALDEHVVDYLNDAELDHVVVAGEGGERGDYAIKINEGYRASAEPFMFLGADDIVFQPGWYEAARKLMFGTTPDGKYSSYGPDYQLERIGVVGTVDDCNPRTMAGTASTHSLVARWYADEGACIDQDHVIYHEGYWHEYCDDELVQTAIARDAYAHALDAHVTHHHPINDSMTVEDDEVYQRGRANSRRSRVLFTRRRTLWNPGTVRR